MTTRSFHFFVCSVFAAIPLWAAGPVEEGPDQEGIVFFEKKIRPLLVRYCYECHSDKSEELAGGLRLDTREAVRRGGDTGPAVVPNRISESLLIDAIRHDNFEMPPDKERLSDQSIKDFEDWINMGAPDPRGGNGDSSGQTADNAVARKHWAYQSLTQVRPPSVKNKSWPRGDIDQFILACLEKSDLAPVSDADRYTLLRRATYDLTGLPPTYDEIQHFIKDAEVGAFARVVDRLLKSEHFGERWGRHWLDVARYADSTGGGRDQTYTNAWRYRDYVIDSFNADKSYRQFLTEQVAGDLLPFTNDDQRQEQIVATGFLVVGPKNLGERLKEKTRMDIVDEQIDTVGRAFLGLTLGCARCHKHKFDPVSLDDYYGMAGIFSSTRVLKTPKPTDAASRLQPVPLPIDEPTAKRLEAEFKAIKDETRIRKAEKLAYVKQLEERLAELQSQASHATEEQVAALEKKLVKARFDADIATGEHGVMGNFVTALPVALAVSDLQVPADERVRIRGQVDSKGKLVPRGFLSVLTGEHTVSIPSDQSGRLQLAQWLIDPASPASALTSRVMVNRVWKHLFGTGIVRTTDNFGVQGESPSHPQLLDYLASEFISNDWSTKDLIRKIMLSRVYQLAAEKHEVATPIDPDNRLLWRTNGRRMDVEAIRDSILTISRLIDNRRGGSTLTLVGALGSSHRGFRTVEINPYYRRGVYLPIIRSGLAASMDMYNVFDFPDSGLVTGRRNSTTVPTQALYLMNSPFMVKNAQHTAQRVLENSTLQDERSRIRWVFLTILGRPATETETTDSLNYIESFRREMTSLLTSNKSTEEAAWASFCQSLFASNEFLFLN